MTTERTGHGTGLAYVTRYFRAFVDLFPDACTSRYPEKPEIFHQVCHALAPGADRLSNDLGRKKAGRALALLTDFSLQPRSGMSQVPGTRTSLLYRLRDSANQQAWQEFVEIYTPLVHGFCCHRGLQDADAADIAQEVMRAVARTMPTFEYQPDKGR